MVPQIRIGELATGTQLRWVDPQKFHIPVIFFSVQRYKMPLARQRTTVRGPPRRKPPKPGYLKKTSKKGAYNKNAKRQFAKRRAPFVETKRKTDEDVLADGFFAGTGDINANGYAPDRMALQVYDTEHLMMDPYSFLLWSQGLSQASHISQAVTLKYTNMKIQVRFPQPSVSVTDGSYTSQQNIPAQPMNYELVWGLVPAPLQLTGSSEPAANTVTLQEIRQHINDRVTDYFNNRKDFLRFIPKKDATLRIHGRRKVKPALSQSTLHQMFNTDSESPIGTIPDYHTEISWKWNNRKLWLEQTGNANGDEDCIAMYPNYAWLPFCTLVNWNHADIPNSTVHNKKLESPSVAWNSITYFSDS